MKLLNGFFYYRIGAVEIIVDRRLDLYVGAYTASDKWFLAVRIEHTHRAESRAGIVWQIDYQRCTGSTGRLFSDEQWTPGHFVDVNQEIFAG